MADKYLKRDATTGRLTEVEGTVTSAGAGDAGELVALDAAGKLDTTVMPVGVGADTVTVPSTENLSAGDLVNLYDATGTTSARKADGGTTGKAANGFVTASVTNPDDATVYLFGTNAQVSGLTPGPAFLSASAAGGVQSTPPTGTGETSQRVGYAVTATSLIFAPEAPVDLA